MEKIRNFGKEKRPESRFLRFLSVWDMFLLGFVCFFAPDLRKRSEYWKVFAAESMHLRKVAATFSFRIGEEASDKVQ